jgi:DNA-binding MarR family transcriptional regulator
MKIMPTHSFSRVIWAVRRTGKAVQAVKELQLRPLDLAAAHYALLSAISLTSGATVAELARDLGVTPQNVAGLTSRLEQRGLVTRQAHPRHKHVMELLITPEGGQLLRAADASMVDLETSIGEILGEDGAETLRSLLEKLCTELEERLAKAKAGE